MTRRVGAADQRRSVVLALLALLVAAAAAAAVPSTFGAFTTTVTNERSTAASSVFGSTDTCQSVTNVGTPYFLYPLNDAAGASAAADTSGQTRPGTYRGTPIGYCVSEWTQWDDRRTSDFQHQHLVPDLQHTGRPTDRLRERHRHHPLDRYRHLYLTDAGRLIFGVRPNSQRTVIFATGYNDNTWHHAVATLSLSTGMRLYLDGALVSSDAAVTSAQVTTGQWRIGWDNVAGWLEAPTSEYYQGSLAWASVHDTVLTAAQVRAIYDAGR